MWYSHEVTPPVSCRLSFVYIRQAARAYHSVMSPTHEHLADIPFLLPDTTGNFRVGVNNGVGLARDWRMSTYKLRSARSVYTAAVCSLRDSPETPHASRILNQFSTGAKDQQHENTFLERNSIMDSSHTCTMLCRMTITSAAERSFFSRSSARSTAELPLSTDSRALEATGPRFPLLPLLVRRLPPVLLLLRITPLARLCYPVKTRARQGGDQCSMGIDRGRAQRSCPVFGAPGARSG